MLLDNDIIPIVLNDIDDCNVIVKSEVEIGLTLKDVSTATINLATLSDIFIVVDMDTLDSSDPGDPGAYRNLIAMPMRFWKSIIGRKHTFGSTSLSIITQIRTGSAGYGTGIYGTGVYSPSVGAILQYGSIDSPITFTKSIVGRKTTFGSTSLSMTLGRSVGGTQAKQTAVGEISLSSVSAPAIRRGHSIKIRARTLVGSGAVIKAALYEGSTNRSGDLSSIPLSNFLNDYTLVIPDASAAAITSYDSLSIRFWGYDSSGVGLVFEISRMYLELSASGDISLPITFTKNVAGTKKTYGSISRSIGFGSSVSGVLGPPKQTSIAEISLASHTTPSSRANHSIKIRARTTSGSTGVIKAALYEGTINRSGDLSSNILSNTLTEYTLPISSVSAGNITSYSNLSIRIWGYDSIGNALVFEVSEVKLQLPSA